MGADQTISKTADSGFIKIKYYMRLSLLWVLFVLILVLSSFEIFSIGIKMDHSMHHNPDMHHHMGMNHHDGMMKMYFHGGCNEVILFSFWRISTIGGLIGSMIGCFLLGVLYEGLKFFREFMLRQEYRSMGYSNVSPSPDSVVEEAPESSGPVPSVTRSVEADRQRSQIKIIQTNLFSKGHILQTFLQLLQVVLSYGLMLIFMTYNVWLCAAVAFGASAGYFVFGWKKTVVLDAGGDHCH